MSMMSQGPGWWQASDGRWYPPEAHPDAASAQVPPPAPQQAPSGSAWMPPDGASAAGGGGAAPPPFPQPGPYATPNPYAPQGPPPGSVPPPAPTKGPRRGPLIAVALVVLVLLVAAVAWALVAVRSGGDDADPGDTGSGGDSGIAVDTDFEGDTDVYDLAVGDCIDDPLSLGSDELVEIQTVDMIPCDEPHDAEVYALEDLPQGDDEPFPGDDEVAMQSDAICFELFESYVGAPYEDSALDYSYYLPIEESWNSGDRGVACLLYAYDGTKLDQPMRGSGR